MTFRKKIDATDDAVWHFSPECHLWPQTDYRESNEPPSLAFEHLCEQCRKLDPSVSEEQFKE